MTLRYILNEKQLNLNFVENTVIAEEIIDQRHDSEDVEDKFHEVVEEEEFAQAIDGVCTGMKITG